MLHYQKSYFLQYRMIKWDPTSKYNIKRDLEIKALWKTI